LQIFTRTFTLKGIKHFRHKGEADVKSSGWIGSLAGVAGALTALVLLVGFGFAARQIWYPEAGAGQFAISTPAAATSNPQADKPQLRIVALGDSLTAGVGDNTGKGYVGRFRDKLEAQSGKPVYVLNNLAVPGRRTPQLLDDLAQKKTLDAIAEADIVVLTIGGNDIFEGGADVLTGEGDEQEFNPQAAEPRIAPALARLEQILAIIHKANPQAQLMYVGLYHPFLDIDPERAGSLVVQRWNDGAFALINRYPGAVLVPTYDLFENNLLKYLYSDHFHPNGDGYERIAERMAQILR